jgi:hypothetical protein
MTADFHFEDGTPDYYGTAVAAGYCCTEKWAGVGCHCAPFDDENPTDEEMIEDGWHLSGGAWTPNPATEKGRKMIAETADREAKRAAEIEAGRGLLF